MNYYEALTVKPVTSLDISNYNSLNKYLILHRDVAIWHLSGIMVNYEGLEGNLSNVPFERAAYQISIASQWYRYKRRNKSDVLDQIHLYLKDSIVPVFDSNGHIKITLMDIKKAEVYQKDRLRTSVSRGDTFGPYCISCSFGACPFVSSMVSVQFINSDMSNMDLFWSVPY